MSTFMNLFSNQYVMIGSIVLVFMFFAWVVRRASKPEGCAVCGAMTKSVFEDANGKTSFLCKKHLAERWKKDFTASTQNMVLLEPDFVHYPYGYMYASPAKLKQWSYSKKAIERIEAILGTIAGKNCATCAAPATVAVYRADEYNVPLMENLTEPHAYSCKACAADSVATPIAQSKEPIVEGVMAPTNEAGVYHVQEF